MTVESTVRFLETIKKSVPSQIGQSWVLVAVTLASDMLSYVEGERWGVRRGRTPDGLAGA